MTHTTTRHSTAHPTPHSMPHRVPFRRGLTAATGIALAVVLAGVLTACGSDDSDAAAAEHNDADVTFASDMIVHHQQAIEMAQMVDDKTVDPEVADLANDIEAAQAPEIELMTGWLEDWDEPVPSEGSMGHSNMEGMDHGGGSGDGADSGDGGDGGDGGSMTGMMTAEDMAALEAAEGPAFQTMWLDLMVEHHEGAVTMAQSELDQGQYEPALEVARTIIETQQAEISVMENLLAL